MNFLEFPISSSWLGNPKTLETGEKFGGLHLLPAPGSLEHLWSFGATGEQMVEAKRYRGQGPAARGQRNPKVEHGDLSRIEPSVGISLAHPQ